MGLAAVWLAWLWLDSSLVQTPNQLSSDIPEILVLSLIVDYASNGPAWLKQLWACFGCLMLITAGFISMVSSFYYYSTDKIETSSMLNTADDYLSLIF